VISHLTHREEEVFELLSHGATDKEIAARLGMRQSTVGNHVHSIQTKLRVRTRMELGMFVGRLGSSGP
jgi:DNA-binding NarL/FixJ family response regulator